MRVDRLQFVRLALLIAASCKSAAPAHRIDPDPTPSAKPTPDVGPACSNAIGSAAACAKVSPACEGLQEECTDIAQDLRPRVAEAFTKCFAESKPPKCKDKAFGACMRAAIETTCIEPGSVAVCEALMRACANAKRPATYSLELCARVVSAVPDSKDPLGWRVVDEERMGPSGAKGCSLDGVLPYQPFGPNWR